MKQIGYPAEFLFLGGSVGRERSSFPRDNNRYPSAACLRLGKYQHSIPMDRSPDSLQIAFLLGKEKQMRRRKQG
ncbi:hypothetical protein EJB05_20868, partial [Eragrostis curvula]